MGCSYSNADVQTEKKKFEAEKFFGETFLSNSVGFAGSKKWLIATFPGEENICVTFSGQPNLYLTTTKGAGSPVELTFGESVSTTSSRICFGSANGPLKLLVQILGNGIAVLAASFTAFKCKSEVKIISFDL
jgi:hypothetical protein